MKHPKHILAALQRVGMRPADVLVARDSAKHLRLTLPNGRQLTCANTPSDSNAHRQIARDIQRCLGQRNDWTNRRSPA